MAASLLALAAFALATDARAAGACPDPAPTAAAIDAVPIYKQGTYAKDRSAEGYNAAALSDLHGFVESIDRLSDDVVRGDAAAARCFASSLAKWVQTAPMTAPGSDQASNEQQWALASIALAIVKAEAYGVRIDPAVEAWLRTVSGQVQAFQDAKKLRNNLAAWGALAVGATAYVLNDEASWRWALRKEAMVTDQIGPDGILPKEMSRGPRASTYHVFATMPLLALNLLKSCRGGQDQAQAAAMQRLLGLLDTIGSDNQYLAARAGNDQIPSMKMPVIHALAGKSSQGSFEWMLGGDVANLRQAASRCRR